MIELFEHNQVAYEAAKKMLWDTGKAAIVHPTGTGKSFVGFKFCEERGYDRQVMYNSWRQDKESRKNGK